MRVSFLQAKLFGDNGDWSDWKSVSARVIDDLRVDSKRIVVILQGVRYD